jgi:hypothetical protein
MKLNDAINIIKQNQDLLRDYFVKTSIFLAPLLAMRCGK